MESNNKDKDKDFEAYKENIKKIIDSGQIPIAYISELTTDNGGKLIFSHYGKNKDGETKAFYILD